MAPRLLEAQLSPDRVSFMVGGKESSIMASARVPVPIRTTEDLNSFRIAMRQFDTAAEKCGLDPGMLSAAPPAAGALAFSARQDGRRHDSRVRRIPRAAQQRARSLQRRHSLPSGGHF